MDAVRAGDLMRVRAMIEARPELVNMDTAENDERRALHHAVLRRASEMVRLLMRHGADARKGVYPHRKATGALTMAVERGYDEIVAIIYEEEQGRRATRGQGTVTPAQDELIEAIWNGDEARAMSILESDPASITGMRPSRLDAAARGGGGARRTDRGLAAGSRRGSEPARAGRPDRPGSRRREGVEEGREDWRAYPAVAGMLLARGAELTARSAVALGEADWLRARHAEGALVNEIEGPGGLLSLAVRHDRPEMLALLLDLGLDPDERTRLGGLEEAVYSWGMPLHHCAGLGKYAMAEMLLEHGADANGQVYASGSVMYSALAAGDSAMVELLERHGGLVDAATAGHLRLTEHARRMFTDQDAGRLREGTYMNANGTLAEELLWAGLRGGDPEIVRMSLERVDWPRDHPDWYGKLWSPLPGHTPRSESEHEQYLACFRRVLERCDASARHPRFGRTVLHDVAASDGAVSPEEAFAFATVLLDAGARLDIRDGLLESTTLGWACRWGRVELVKLLLDRGADPVEADAEPWARPLAWAEKMGHDAVVSVLRAGPQWRCPGLTCCGPVGVNARTRHVKGPRGVTEVRRRAPHGRGHRLTASRQFKTNFSPRQCGVSSPRGQAGFRRLEVQQPGVPHLHRMAPTCESLAIGADATPPRLPV